MEGCLRNDPRIDPPGRFLQQVLRLLRVTGPAQQASGRKSPRARRLRCGLLQAGFLPKAGQIPDVRSPTIAVRIRSSGACVYLLYPQFQAARQPRPPAPVRHAGQAGCGAPGLSISHDQRDRSAKGPFSSFSDLLQRHWRRGESCFAGAVFLAGAHSTPARHGHQPEGIDWAPATGAPRQRAHRKLRSNSLTELHPRGPWMQISLDSAVICAARTEERFLCPGGQEPGRSISTTAKPSPRRL